MEAKEIVNLFDHQRHDRMNDIQLLLAYAAMGKIDKVEAKLREKVNEADQERKLSNLNIPETALWVMAFNWRHDDIRMTYNVNLEKADLSEKDEEIKRISQHVLDVIRLYFTPFYLYQVSFYVGPAALNEANAEIKLSCEGIYTHTEQLAKQLEQINELEQITLVREEENTICLVSWTCK